MVADVLNNYIPEKISLENTDKGNTYRKILFDALNDHFFENLGINLIFGYKTDEVSQKLFLPKELMEGVSNTKTSIGPLAETTITVNKFSGEKNISLWNNFYAFGVLCLLLMIVSANKLVQYSFLALTGLLGILFCVIWLYSSHIELGQNYNVLLVSPLSLLLLCFIFSNKTKATLITSYTSLAFIGLYIVFMLNKPHLILTLPLIILTIVIHLRIIKTNRKAAL
jgi:hypothetical protein